jgi:hypothetical protein
MAPNTIADSLQDGVLDGVPVIITPSLIRRANKHGLQCPICEAARRKREVTAEGSGAIPGVIGAIFSWDELHPRGKKTPDKLENFRINPQNIRENTNNIRIK